MSGLTNAEMLSILRQKCEQAGGQKAWADAHGFSAAYVSDVLGGRRDVSEAVANSLGYMRTVRFRRVLEDAPK